MKKNGRLVLDLDKKIHPKEAIIATCCQFLASSYIFLEDKDKIRVILTPKNGDLPKKFGEEFEEELTNNTLRYHISCRNKDIRDCIVKAALFGAQPRMDADALLSGGVKDGLSSDWKKDPLGIAVPWQDKHAGKKMRSVK